MQPLTPTEDRHNEDIKALLPWFSYAHLPEGPAQHASMQFHDLAIDVVSNMGRPSLETVLALQSLATARDWAVRAVLLTQRREDEHLLESLAPEDEPPPAPSGDPVSVVKQRQGRLS